MDVEQRFAIIWENKEKVSNEIHLFFKSSFELKRNTFSENQFKEDLEFGLYVF